MADVDLVERVREAPVHEAGRRSTPWPALGVLLTMAVAVVVTLTVSGGAPRPAPAGLPDPGAVTGWSLPLVRGAMDLGAIGTVGSLLTAAFLLPSSDGRLGVTGRKALRAAAWWAWAWMASSLALVTVSTSDVLGVPMSTVLGAPALQRYGWQLPEGRALLVMALAAFAVALNSRSIRTRLGSVLLLLVAVTAMTPLLLTGHSASAADHYVATQSLLVHVLGATLWVGGLLGLVLLVRGDRDSLRFAVPRFSMLALVCFVVVALSGVVTAWTRLGLAWDSWWSTYGALLAAKTVALLALGLLGLVHRRRTVPGVVAGTPRAFTRLAVVEVLLMSATVAVAVVLSRTAPPVGVGLGPDSSHGGSFTTVDRNIDPVSLAQLVGQWRPDALVVTAVTMAAVGYLLAVRHVRRRGQTWPVARVVWAMAGLAVILFVLCGGVGSYSSALLSVQLAQFLAMLTVAPVLVTLGAPVRLVRAASGVETRQSTSAMARRLADPVNGVTVMLGLLVLVYATPLLNLSLRSLSAHLLVNVLAFAAGLLAFWSILARDWLPETRSVADRSGLVGFLAALLAVFAVLAWRADGAYGAEWFEELDLWWSGAVPDRLWAGLVVATFAAGMLALQLLLRREGGAGVPPAARTGT